MVLYSQSAAKKKTAKISVCLSLLLCIQNTNAPEAVELEISSAESCWDAVAPCAITHTVLLHKKVKLVLQ